MARLIVKLPTLEAHDIKMKPKDEPIHNELKGDFSVFVYIVTSSFRRSQCCLPLKSSRLIDEITIHNPIWTDIAIIPSENIIGLLMDVCGMYLTTTRSFA
jgi:hypothetical protein